MAKKIGRNQPCPCGSGKKYKFCHGAFTNPMPAGMAEALEDLLREKKAKEHLRTRQQGFGKPIISTEYQGYRIVAIGSRLAWNRNWHFFPDFLLTYCAEVCGLSAKKAAEQISLPVKKWYDDFAQYNRSLPSGASSSSKGLPMTPVTSRLFYFAYALYLIEHHDQIPSALIKRLSNTATFSAAVYETLVAAAVVLSGAKISMAELGKSSKPEPEFTMIAKSGQTYSIEAKRRQSWTHAPDYSSDSFLQELGLWIRNKIHAASKKRLKNPIFFLELNISEEWPEEGWMQVHDAIAHTIKSAEDNLTVFGEKIAPAYIFVTNHAAFDEASKSTSRQHMLFGCAIPNFPPTGVDLEELFTAYDDHHDVAWIAEALQIASGIPATFDGTPPELALHSNEVGYGLKIGRKLTYLTEEEKEAVGVIEDVAAFSDKAFLIVRNENGGTRSLFTSQFSELEAAAFQKYGHAIFGISNTGSSNIGNHPIEAYKALSRIYSDFNRNGLLRQVSQHPSIEEFKQLATEELRVRVSREVAKSVWYHSQAHTEQSDSMKT